MTQGRDREDDDPQLASLRAMWLTLPDEEPSSRGLADLMAAARTKADTMAGPPWHQRVFAVLRRPPVLVLATVAVLLGGLLVAHRRERVLDPAAPDVALESREASGEPRSRTAQPMEPAPPGPALADTLDERSEAIGGAEPAAIPNARNSAAAQPGDSNERKATGVAQAQLLESETLELALDDRKREEPVDSVGDLHTRARSAAARGDCATTKALVNQIAKRDPAYYRTRVARDKTLTCP